MSTDLLTWWVSLCTISAINIVGLSLTVFALSRRRAALSAKIYASRRLQLMLSAGYVLGCAYRSALPVYDVQRLCLVDSWMSSVIVGRSVATIAELCFVTQWALLLREMSWATDSKVASVASLAIVPLIVVAEAFSWYSVLTTSNIGHVLEESLWGICAALLVAGLSSSWPRSTKALRPYLLGVGMIGISYIWFMFTVDVPMYWARWIVDEASGRLYFSVWHGIADASERWVVSHQWNDWKSEVIWMSLYFSFAVWLSIALIHTPTLERRMAPAEDATPNEFGSC